MTKIWNEEFPTYEVRLDIYIGLKILDEEHFKY